MTSYFDFFQLLAKHLEKAPPKIKATSLLKVPTFHLVLQRQCQVLNLYSNIRLVGVGKKNQ